jgi:hypothetical protein
MASYSTFFPDESMQVSGAKGPELRGRVRQPPSIELATGYLRNGRDEWILEITHTIALHHKLTHIRDSRLAEIFRRSDLIDVSLGLFRWGLPVATSALRDRACRTPDFICASYSLPHGVSDSIPSTLCQSSNGDASAAVSASPTVVKTEGLIQADVLPLSNDLGRPAGGDDAASI